MNQLIPALASTLVPVLILAPIIYALRPQGGTRWLRTRPVPARRLLARCAVDREQGLIPADSYGGVDRPSLWTVPATDRDFTGAFPVVRAA